VLAIRDLRVQFRSNQGVVRAVDGVSFSVGRNETLGIVGESGCGKSVTALALMRLIRDPPGRIVGGSVRLDGTDLLALGEPEMRALRGNEISIIFQEPMTSLNPLLTVGRQIGEAMVRHRGLPERKARHEAIAMLQLVHIPEPHRRAREYPHQLSGGMRQRVMVAMALCCNPKVLIADEPTTALDVTIQAQIMDLLRELQAKLGTAVILITHDMGLIAENARTVCVMYAGRIVERADVRDLFAFPCHPYTQGLLASIPRLDFGEGPAAAGPPSRLSEIRGMVPSLSDRPPGCFFEPRCPFATARCRADYPPLEEKRPGHLAACWHSDRVLERGA
jgi:oligopeptide/dipeptide ABC transporter ATP-binding protein